ncbi:DUF2125 domain-containing protein [Paracoccus onubensis]|uniref:DUF2125 domain-containing protein n=1 Tax=Paracoccus onubensis TaxID=1675788 RepID=UPI00272FF12A|nr:DUF2125 domain-containing protein [Paracoccus onubensis]MDP0930324.1 DUF2125 domain-containing protein [Paracoccus onubensis]
MQRTLASSAIALIVAAGPALAELTPAQVWDNLSGYYTSMGYEVTVGSQDETDGNLSLTDVVFTSEIDQPDAATSVSATVPKITLEQTDDAKVRTVFDGEMTVESTTDVPDQEPMSFRLVMTAPENEMISSGTENDMLHEFDFPTLESKLYFGSATPDADSGEAPVTLTLTESTGQYRTVHAENQEITYEMVSKGLDVALNVTEPPAEDGTSGNGKVTGQAHVDGVTFTGTTSIPGDIKNLAERLDLALNAGFVAQGKAELGKMNGDMTFEGMDENDQPQSGDAKFNAESSDLTFAMSKEGLTYGGNSGATEVEANFAQLPFPITYSIDKASGEATFPVSKGEDAQPFALKYELAGVKLADAIWDQFDPGKELPRDPANLKLDLTGEAVVKNDLFDPAFAQKLEAQAADPATDDPATDDPAAEGEAPDATAETSTPPTVPFEPRSLKINEVVLQAVGADANLTGDLTFADLEQPPVGVIEGDFKGINALLDKLVAMGIVPQDQLMGARMMLAMFAQPAEGDPDHLQTKIEFKEGGSIFANGQQVK